VILPWAQTIMPPWCCCCSADRRSNNNTAQRGRAECIGCFRSWMRGDGLRIIIFDYAFVSHIRFVLPLSFINSKMQREN
jgi:hypothetical protein